MTTADGGSPAREAIAAAAPGAPAAGAAPDRRFSDRAVFWQRSRRGWDLAFYALVTVAGAALLSQVGDDPPRLTRAGAALGVLVLGYTVLGRRAARTADRRFVAAYLAVLVVSVVVATTANPTGSILLFVAYSQVWYFAESRRSGVALSVVLTVGVFGAIATSDWVQGPGALANLLAQAAVALVFSVALGLWVTLVAERSEERAELVERLEAAQAALADVHHAAGVVAERERMAREIHDTLAQGFTSVVVLAQGAQADVRRGDAAAAVERLALMERTARENLAEARALVAAFSPVALDGTTLEEALGRLAERWTAETGVPVELELGGRPGLDREDEVVLLRAAQEALTNVRRHAGARSVRLRLAPAGPDAAAGHVDHVELEVTDDGSGLEEAVVEGFGLRGMRDRVAAGGGHVHLGPGPAGGTRLRVRVPVPATSEAGSAAVSDGPPEGAR